MMWWLALGCTGTPPAPDRTPFYVPTVPDPTGPTDETGALPSITGDTGDTERPNNLITNGDFESDCCWDLRLGIAPQLADAPQRRGRAMFVDDPGFDVSWTWSEPVEVQGGDGLCLRADTFKTNTTNSGFPRVWVRFFSAVDAGPEHELLLDSDFNVLDVDTSEQNRDAPDDVWVPVVQTVLVPTGVGARALRVILTANASATGELYWDDVTLTGSPCPP